MISVAEALELVLTQGPMLEASEAAAQDALGRALARDVTSDIDSPPWDKSMMDGFALHLDDIANTNKLLDIVEEVMAGQVPQVALSPGKCTRIMTGAPVPANTSAVAMVEKTELVGKSQVRISVPWKPGQNVLKRAASLRKGEVVIRAGNRLRPIEIGLLAETGNRTVLVRGKPKVAILSTGDELVDAGQTPAPGQIRNSNGPMLAALVNSVGGLPAELGVARDNEEELFRKIGEGLGADVLLLSGGVSAGVLDLVPKTLAKHGVKEVFHHVNLKPGKPLWFGARDKTCVFGLPGNPVSTLVCFGLFVKPLLEKLAGYQSPPREQLAALAKEFIQRDPRPTYFPAVLTSDKQQDTVKPLPWQGSADLRALAEANCLMHVPGGEKTYPPGEKMTVFPI